MNQSPINLPYQRFRPIRGLYPADVRLKLTLTPEYVFIQLSLSDGSLYFIPTGSISSNVHFTNTPFFLEVLWSVVNCYLYSIGPVHFVVGDNRLSYAPWPHHDITPFSTRNITSVIMNRLKYLISTPYINKEIIP